MHQQCHDGREIDVQLQPDQQSTFAKGAESAMSPVVPVDIFSAKRSDARDPLYTQMDMSDDCSQRIAILH
jgi:hypothetical protein